MLRNRNTFFADQNYSAQSYMPNQPINQVPYNQGAPYQSSQASQSFYAGPNPYQGSPTNQPINDYDNRLAKIERQINRLDARLTKLENASKITTDDISSSMYML